MPFRKLLLSILATAATLAAAPQLKLSTTAIGPLQISQNANGPNQTVTASNAGDGALALSASATATWLSPTVSGNSILIALNTSALAPGSYTEFVTVTSPGAVDAPQNISVTIQVGGIPGSLTFYAAPGGTAVSQVVQAQSMLNAVASASGGWLSVSLNQQGSFTAFYPYLVSATPQAGQAAGDYTGTVAFSGGSNPPDNKTVNVTLHLTAAPIQQFTPSALTLYSSNGYGKVSGTVALTNAGQGTLTATGATGSAAWLSAAVSGNVVTVTADPAGMAAGGYQGTVTVQSNAANATATIPVELIVLPSSAPQLSFGGVVDNATFAPTLAPGMIAQAYGLQLSGATPALAPSLPLSSTLSGVQITVNGVPAPLFYTSNGVVDFAVPWATPPGPATVALSYNGVLSNTVSANVVARAPRLLYFPLTVNGNQYFYGVMINASDGSLPIPVTPGFNGHPAKAGDTLTVYLVGMGATNQNVADGAASPGSPTAITPTPNIFLGGGFAGSASDAVVQYSGLTPGSANLYQINVTLPADTPVGDQVAFMIQIEGAISNHVFFAVSK